MNRPDPASDTFPLPDPTGTAPGSPDGFSGQAPRRDPADYERSAWQALDVSEFERVLARADELEALGRGSSAQKLRSEVREGLIGQMLADPTRSSAARWLGLLLRVDPEAAEEFERRARRGPAQLQESTAGPGSPSSESGPTESAPTASAPTESERGPARTLPLGAPLQRCGLRLRLDGLGELGLAACEALQWAPEAESGAPPGARFEPGLWLAHEGPRNLCLPLGPGSFEVLDERGEAAGAPRESLELSDALRFRWTIPGGGAPRILSAQRWGAVWLLAITRGADLAGARRIAWWPGPGRLELDPADTRLPLNSLPAALGLELGTSELRLSSTAGLRPTSGEGASRVPELGLDLPLPGPVALAVGGRTWLRVEPWEQAP